MSVILSFGFGVNSLLAVDSYLNFISDAFGIIHPYMVITNPFS